MTQQRDLEKSLREILTRQLRELVVRCAPKAGWADQEQISTQLERMINAWINAEPESRPAVLSSWLKRINTIAAVSKAVKDVKAGKSLVVSSSLFGPISAKAANPTRPKEESRSDLPFDVVESKLSRLASAYGQTSSREVKSEKIAELLNVSKRKVDEIRQKLRDSGYDFSFFLNVETSVKNSRKHTAGSKPPRGD